MLGGPHSRDYDSLFRKGMLNGQLVLVRGFRSRDERQDEIYQCTARPSCAPPTSS